MRKLLIVLVVLSLIGVAGWFAYQQVWIPRQEAAAEPEFETTSVERGSISSTVSATGSIEPADELSFSFHTPGLVDAVYVTAGQAVEEGQLLAELDSTDLTLAVAQAKVSLEINDAQLQKLLEPPSEDDLAAAQAAVEVAQVGVAGAEAALYSAQAAYRDLLAGPSAAQREVNRAQVLQAEAEVKRAQQAYNEVKSLPNVGALPQSTQLEQATIALETARTQAAITDTPANEAEIAGALNAIAQAEVSLRQAQSNLITAGNNLKDLLEGPDEQDIRIAEAQLRQTQLSQLQAESNLANTRLTAPFDGVVSRVDVKPGEQAGNGAPAFVLTDLDDYFMEVLVDEIDVRQIAVGQPVRIRVDALPDAELTGKVTEVSPTSQDVGGVIAYEVTVVPNATDAPLRAGLSATAIVTTADVSDAVLLPNRYIQRNRETGQAFVNKMVDGQPVLQEIELGLRNERESQILAGLTDGDEVALVTLSSEEQLRGALFGGGE